MISEPRKTNIGLKDNLVTVIIPVYNGHSTLSQSLVSLKTQSTPPGQILIIDDCSTDGSIALTRKILGGSSLNFRIIHHPKTQGLAGSYNEGIKNSKYELIVTMHQDVILHQNALRTLIDPLLKSSEVVASSHAVNHPLSIWKKYNFWQKCYFSRLAGKKYYGIDGKFDCYRRKALLSIGMFDQRAFHSAGEDRDVVEKLRRLGKIAKTEAEIVHLHKMDNRFGPINIIKKQAQYSEAQGALLRRYGITSLTNFGLTFFREILIVSLAVPFLNIIAGGLILIYSFYYTKLVFLTNFRNFRIIALPFLNISLLFVSLFFSLRGFIYGKEQI